MPNDNARKGIQLSPADRMSGAEQRMMGQANDLNIIAEGGYCYPPGDQRRYTAEGWEQWKKIAIREGVPLPPGAVLQG